MIGLDCVRRVGTDNLQFKSGNSTSVRSLGLGVKPIATELEPTFEAGRRQRTEALMTNRRLTLIPTLLLIAAFLHGFTWAQDIPAKLDALFTSPLYPVNGNVLVAEHGTAIYKKSFGFADARSKRLSTAASRFQLASVTKVFTSTAVLQLRDRGKLRLDDPFAKYFPEFPYPEITVRQLLSHTAGLPDFQIFEELVEADPSKTFTNADVIPALQRWKQPLMFKPGEAWSYSNPGYCLLALLVEKSSGLRFEDYVRHHIFAPAGMTESYFDTDTRPSPDANKAMEQRYALLIDKDLQSVEKSKWQGFVGNGGLISTTGELLRFDSALYSGALLKTQTLEEAFTPARLTNGQSAQTDTLNAFYGLGWFILNTDSDGKIVWHGGGRPGVVTVFLRNISKQQTVVVLDNSFNRETYRIGFNAMNILNGKPVAMRKKSLVRDYARALIEAGSDAAFCRLVELRSDSERYVLDEEEMNDLALQLLYAGASPNHNELAVDVARLNIAFFPESFNVYDTYGEILAALGRKELAIAMYRKSIEMNPNNESGKRALEELDKK
jgi:CubicO group peptidase (beta-lactamase class C family)